MKANEAPDKIYIDNFGSELSHDYHTEHSYENDIEYTRTDAFIAKAQKWLKENVSKYLYNTGGRDEYIPTCSGKLFEDFNNAMKEE